jgi:hypothetical protein
MSLWIPFVAITILAGLATVMAKTSLRDRLIGASPMANAMVPLLAGGLAWGTSVLVGPLAGEIADGAIPAPTISVFVEDIDFGLPEIPADYKSRELNTNDLERVLRPFVDSAELISLNASEADRLNRLAQPSGMAGNVMVTTYTMPEVARLITGPVAYYSKYESWRVKAQQMSDQIVTTAATDVERRAAMWSFVNGPLYSNLDSAGIMRGIVGMADRQELGLEKLDGDCVDSPISGITYALHGDDYNLSFATFGMTLASTDDSVERREKAEKMAKLFQYGCLRSLKATLQDASRRYASETDLMGRYLEEWSEILRSRKSKSMKLRVTFANTGKYDVFVRKDAKIAVGPQDGSSQNKIEAFITESSYDGRQKVESPYFSVRSRSAETKTFVAKFKDDVSAKFHGAYVGELSYLRMGGLVNSGEHEQPFLSAIAPFSTAARGKMRDRIEKMTISF